MEKTFTASQINEMKNVFQAAYPGVKCTFDKNTVIPSFVYQDGPALSKVEKLLASYDVQVIRVINANLLGKAAQKFFGRYVNTMNDHTRRGFFGGFILTDENTNYNDVKRATAHIMELDAEAC